MWLSETGMNPVKMYLVLCQVNLCDCFSFVNKLLVELRHEKMGAVIWLVV